MILAVHRFAQWLGLPHWYLSTGCLHGDHNYCAARSGKVGAKEPQRCKFCTARCRCRCHRPTGRGIAAAVRRVNAAAQANGRTEKPGWRP